MIESATGLSQRSANAIRQYDSEGFTIFRGVFSDSEIRDLEAEADRLHARKDLIDTDNIRCRWQNHYQTGECRFDCFDPVIDLSPLCGQIAHHARLLERLESIYEERACLFKDKLMFKIPGAEGYKLHQDYIAWDSFPTTFLTAIVAIDACDEENGATEVFSGYHRRGCMSPRDGKYHRLPDEAVDPKTGVVLSLLPGDVAVFSCYTPHRSSSNRSNRSRRVLYLSYNAFSDGGDQRERHYLEFSEWLKDRYAEYGRTMTFFR